MVIEVAFTFFDLFGQRKIHVKRRGQTGKTRSVTHVGIPLTSTERLRPIGINQLVRCTAHIYSHSKTSCLAVVKEERDSEREALSVTAKC